MRKLLSIGLLLCAGLVWWFWPKPSISPAAVTSSDREPAPRSTPAVTNPPLDRTAKDDPRPAAKLEERIEGATQLLNSSNVDIRFWGRVIDQDNKPLEGVSGGGHVQRGYMAAPGYISEKSDKFEVLSREDGTFTIEGLKGSVMEITEVSKEGYERSAAGKWSFAYYDSTPETIFKPNANAPVVLRMWKKIGAESLVHGSKFYGVVPDGRVYGIDMLKGQKVEGGTAGDFTVKITRPAQITPQIKYDWSFVIEGVGGGVIESSDEFMYQAPESGYQPRYEYTMSPTNPNWRETVKKNFYVKSRNGQVYGRIEAEVMSNYQDKAVLNVKYYANPAGSRNLEYDSAQVLK